MAVAANSRPSITLELKIDHNAKLFLWPHAFLGQWCLGSIIQL